MSASVTTAPDGGHILDGAGFADSYQLTVSGKPLCAAEAARLAMGSMPRWVSALMLVRNLLVAPFGLKSGAEDHGKRQRIGIFPLLAETPEQVVLGMDDRHLDFRLVVDVRNAGGGEQMVRATTYVKTHNILGRIYLAVVMPFHRIIVPALLNRLETAR